MYLTCIIRPPLCNTAGTTELEARPKVQDKIKSNQIALLAKAPLIRSTGEPSTGLQLRNMEQYNVYKEEV